MKGRTAGVEAACQNGPPLAVSQVSLATGPDTARTIGPCAESQVGHAAPQVTARQTVALDAHRISG